ncbi:MAG: 2-dehydropantoate 2-reductase [Deltaproteobacteria bacterium]|nr:2-dehydropantoate 2-reductase [Deltaproteobacteria bacterium]MBW2515527.1 2-dehydropantoate 2-reductase [Deltaproteobacteria bacterium]
MNIAIVGAGAMGSLFGALLAEGGHTVWLYDIWQEHIDAVNQNGVTIEFDGKPRRVRLKAVTDPSQIRESELVLIFVKATQTEAAAKTAARLAGTSGLVMTLQNGMGNAETIAQFISPDRILVGTTSHGSTMLKAGSIRHAGAGPTTVGMWATGEKAFESARQIADQFTRAGIETGAVKDVRPVIWGKLLINIGINAITALTGIRNGQILDLEVTRELSRAAVEEAAAVAQAQGIEIRKDATDHVFQVAAATAANRSSMGQDVDHRRPTEIKAINGFVVREAERLKIDVPVNKTLTVLVETMQTHYAK